MKQRIIAITLVLPLLIAYFGCANQGELSGELKILSQSMTVHEFTGGAPQSTAVVRGRAQNVGSATIGSAMIAVNFYDKNENLLATASAVKQNLQPGETWDFSVQTVGPDAWKIVSYDIAASMK
ncbi:MAG: FxLYD domain-containing protein [Dehalococcoidia bacterium]|jgi:hypothetical protein